MWEKLMYTGLSIGGTLTSHTCIYIYIYVYIYILASQVPDTEVLSLQPFIPLLSIFLCFFLTSLL